MIYFFQYAVIAVLSALILISLSIIQKNYEYPIHQYVEAKIISTIQTQKLLQFTEIWDYLHKMVWINKKSVEIEFFSKKFKKQF